MTEHPNKNNPVTLGCGTLILIGLIVLIFGNNGTQELDRKIDQLNKDVQELKTLNQQQNEELRQLKNMVETLIN